MLRTIRLDIGTATSPSNRTSSRTPRASRALTGACESDVTEASDFIFRKKEASAWKRKFFLATPEVIPDLC